MKCFYKEKILLAFDTIFNICGTVLLEKAQRSLIFLSHSNKLKNKNKVGLFLYCFSKHAKEKANQMVYYVLCHESGWRYLLAVQFFLLLPTSQLGGVYHLCFLSVWRMISNNAMIWVLEMMVHTHLLMKMMKMMTYLKTGLALHTILTESLGVYIFLFPFEVVTLMKLEFWCSSVFWCV